MIDWRRGGWTGSLNRWVKREVSDQLRDNPAARRRRRSKLQQALRGFLSIGKFGRFIAIYFVINIIIVALELLCAWLVPEWLPTWTKSGLPPAPDIKALLLGVSSYLIGAQVGVLGVVSIALALITIIAQRENSSTDVQLYYDESLSFEIVASCIGLLAVLCAQLLWPLQFVVHRLGGGTDLQIFKLVLLSIHVAWLLINLAGLAHFVATTFRFVQQSEREALRERYTVNVIQPAAITQRLREQLYRLAGAEMLKGSYNNKHGRPNVWLGFDLDSPVAVEIETDFKHPLVLYDVRVIWVRWVARRWAARCDSKNANEAAGLRPGSRQDGPLLIFTPNLDQPLRGKVAWCARTGGTPLGKLEKVVLRHAFRFRRQRDDA